MMQSFTDQTQRGAMAERPSEIVRVPWFAQEICFASEESVMYTAYNRPNTQYLFCFVKTHLRNITYML